MNQRQVTQMMNLNPDFIRADVPRRTFFSEINRGKSKQGFNVPGRNAKNEDRLYIVDGPLPSFNSVAVKKRPDCMNWKYQGDTIACMHNA
ncbi:uncharacterized protein N7500_009483 [Penicillium coprophilum]|uniref:uncharacterized protein n=1 Tax=Penicillium coprophilum TaxID=36646 RepID=UPI0023841F4D|nr:uncharacterized protein N7500_009483 [Penicillium coprophilum]KAJ5154044.1 hypothetical protein N7500_009483 [Penicillium coprophilum]